MYYFSVFRRLLLSLFSLSLLSACCTQQPVLNFTPEDVSPTGIKINAELKSINVSVARDSMTPDRVRLVYRGNDYEQLFRLTVKEALERASEKSAVFDDDSHNKLALVATILKYETADSGTADLIIHYQLFDRTAHKPMYAKAIESIGAVAGSNDVFKSSVRFNEARNMAVQANIQQFIETLGEFKGFPTSQQHRNRHRDKTAEKQKTD